MLYEYIFINHNVPANTFNMIYYWKIRRKRLFCQALVKRIWSIYLSLE